MLHNISIENIFDTVTVVSDCHS